ncbi:DUF6526 family protein [Cohnella sp. REN36]|uniref:DUF6526 family protein n=1 Tax=Cohnella sp. REN36 TaxID=2887347 RepID=UPI001D13BB8C|nr:DUF6526 family protein [Cohnella sp. REN36]MCC3373872.1 DUF6526 family protein [Cohnella sp. REN36]
MKSQNYGNHVRMVPAFHFVLVPLGLITLAAAIVHLWLAARSLESMFLSLLVVSLSLVAVMTMFFARRFACKVQDRAIRAEESLRHYVLSGRRLDPRLTTGQIIALRFASDEEFLSLCDKAAAEGTTPDRIKASIRAWRADHERA